MVTAVQHPWKLVGPWYRWTRAGVPADGRNAPPAMQKFSSDDFVNEFIKDPQHSLKFDEIDQVYAVHYEAAADFSSPHPLEGKHATLYPADANGDPHPSRTSLVPRGILKLFLPTHSRHYLVVCELHCDFAGFPSVQRDAVCQMGFVVRRRFMSFPDAARPFAAKQVKAIVALQAKIAELDETAPLRPRAAKRRADKMAKLKREGAFAPQRQELTTQLADARKALDHWKSANGVSAIQQGWFPGEHDRIGAWDLVEDEPQSLQESFYPLYPLVADPNDPQHDATGRTMYFGLIPASSFDADVNGKHRYDDESRYQIRCFVRRHNIGCPRKVDAVPDCEGELVWSLPTAHYQLAPQFDLEGTSNRPITIKMPNLAELAAQAVKRPFGKFSPVKFIQPQGLGPQTDGKALLGGSMSGMQICFFSIPLITIIALFVLNIFLPIVVFVFGLWFLLAFKFCIPPSISLNAGIQAELDVVGSAGIDIDADFSVDVNGTFKTTLDINTDLKVGVSTDFATTTQLPQGDIESGLDVFANSPLVDLNGINVETAALPKTVADDPAVIDFSAGLEFEEHRSVGEGAGA